MFNRAKLRWPQCWVCGCKLYSSTKVKEHFEVEHPGVPLVLTNKQLKRARAWRRASTRSRLEGLEPEVSEKGQGDGQTNKAAPGNKSHPETSLSANEIQPESSAGPSVSTSIDDSDEALRPSSRSTIESEVQKLKREESTEYAEPALETDHSRAGSEFSHPMVNASSHSCKRSVSPAAEMSASKRVTKPAHPYCCRLCSKEQCDSPVTLIPCGHIFCHGCMIKALKVGNGCPQPSCGHHPMYQRLTLT